MPLVVTAVLFEPATNERTTVEYEHSIGEDLEASIGGAEFMWTEGNYACDCNRRLFILRQKGQRDYGDTSPCGDTIKLEKLDVREKESS